MASTSSACQVIREWFPCYRVIDALAKDAPPWRSVPSVTALDADPDYLAVATDTGLYWYNRNTNYLHKLKTENTRTPICFVKLVSTVDYMVACGNKIGQVTVFQIPKPHPDTVPDYIKPKTSKQIERYTIADLHKSEITALEWSKNGTKLFSGDKDGIVIQTEIDFYMHICKSLQIVNEAYEIVQLSYCQNYLLVSSVSRSIICTKENSKWNINQVGKKDRRCLSRFGGVFHFSYDKPNEVHVFTVRPGLRIWNSDFHGNVVETLLFKDAVLNPVSFAILLSPATVKKSIAKRDLNFGPLYVFNEKYLVSHHDDILYILDPISYTTVATIDEFRSIRSIAVNKQEIFVLESENHIVRLSYVPDVAIHKTNERMTKSLMNPIQLAISTIKDIANSETKLYFSDAENQRNQATSNLSDSSIPTYTDTTSVVKAEECFELPPVKDLTDDLDNDIVEQLISAMNINDESEKNYNSEIKKKDVKPIENAAHSSQNKSHDSKEAASVELSETIMHTSKKVKRVTPTIVPIYDCYESSKIANESKKTVLPKPSEINSNFNENLLPKKQSPESLEKDIEVKEEKLAKILDLEPVTISTIIPSSSKSNSNIITPLDSIENDTSTHTDISHPKIIETQTKNEKSNNKIPIDLTPQCVSIPNKWNLQEIKIDSNTEHKQGKKSKSNSVDETDWELV